MTNLATDSDLDVLLIRDSFSCVLLQYLSVGARTVTTIDMRHYEEMSVAEYIEGHDIDVVMVAYNPTSLNDTRFVFLRLESIAT